MRLVFYPAILGWFLLGLWIATLYIRIALVKHNRENRFPSDFEKQNNA
jgi:heme exporter protein C